MLITNKVDQAQSDSIPTFDLQVTRNVIRKPELHPMDPVPWVWVSAQSPWIPPQSEKRLSIFRAHDLAI